MILYLEKECFKENYCKNRNNRSDMRNIDEKVLEIAFKSETGSYKESVPFRDYIEWLEEKATQLFLLQSHSNLRNELSKQNDKC